MRRWRECLARSARAAKRRGATLDTSGRLPIACFATVAVVVAAATASGTGRPSAQAVALFGAYWAAVFEFRRRRGRSGDVSRIVAGLCLAAASCHLGWAALHWPVPGISGSSDLPDLADAPSRLLAEPAGFSCLFAPLGIWLSAPRPRGQRRLAYLGPAMGSLPIALATARLGCLAAGCCGGLRAAWGVHPTQVYEVAGCLALAAVVRRLPDLRVAPVVVAGLGLVRLAVSPLRALPALGKPTVSPALVASVLVAVGICGWLAARRDSDAR